MPSYKLTREMLNVKSAAGHRLLGNDNRPLDRIIESDRKALSHEGVTKKELASALRTLYQRASNALGDAVEIVPDITATHHESRGKIPSPILGEGGFEKGEVVLENRMTGDEIVLTPLSLHLIEKYGFFQGRGARNRIDPAAAVKILRDAQIL